MDLETVQLLNLSPIPELSELELSTMLEQLSGLSDINGDLTDRNVEDILKEAENLIDSSMGSKINEVQLTDSVSEKIEKIQCQNVHSVNINEAQESPSDSKSSPVENITPKLSPKKIIDDKNSSSPAEQSNKIFSPGGSSNVIKSTIDSLKEFSTLVEKQLSSRSSGSPREGQSCSEECLNKVDRIKSPKPILKVTKEKTKEPEKNNFDAVKMNKSIKLPNCFERLYQDRPNRSIKKHKVAEKVPKIGMKKKNVKEGKGQAKSGKTSWNKMNESNNLRCKISERMNDNSLPKNFLEVENWLRNSDSKYSPQFDTLPKRMEVESDNNFVQRNDFRTSNCSGISSQLDEKLLLKLLQGMEEIKDHVKNAGAVKNEIPEKMIHETQAVIDNLKSEIVSVRERVTSETMKNAGIQRLEEQFAILKDKYEQHMKKLEEENLKLREALCQKHTAESDPPNELSTPEKKVSRSFSLENCSARRNSICSSVDDIRHREVYSQTEKEPRNISIQCFEEPQFEEVTIEEEFTTKTENKENLTNRRKPVKERPFSEKNIQQLLKQKKTTSEHETQLLATLRGLQTEVNMKEKENRKLKTEIDLLKSQIKKSGKRTEACKRRHIGTQTIGLGPAVQKPYNPEIYEVPRVFEKENEELKSKIKALEEDFELLKEKRVNDLQALHQVHEEEMAKLLSKLETQSALTKHLHSLLVNR